MNPGGPMSGLEAPPDDRELPDQARRRHELLAAIAADRTAPRVRRWAIPLGAAAAVAAIAVAAVALIPLVRSPAPGTRPAAPATTGPAAAPCRAAGGAECRQTDRYAAPAPARGLIVRDEVGSVTVTGTSGGSVSVTEQLVYRGLPPVITRSSADGMLSLGYRCRSNDCGVNFDIAVPRSLNVQVVAGTGAVSLNALAGPLRVTIEVGPVRGQDLASRSAWFGADVGAIDLAFAAAPDNLVAQSGTGAVTLRVPAGVSYAVAANADVGSVTVAVPTDASSGHVIRASSDVGSVAVTGG
jgi:hypothetical protein